ncbi:MAG: 16S rRNA (guanine(527)-N(7))-methyltransferase RsmG [Bacteroidetes bacterium]|jgi:16S rRNA (guanine527-N7)-methyltransferase|nr:16S rRNA (guanine(527)-N(7))-methyltransferase RsmG [Bacteroidota bacterium]|tara:strand:+ start:623 stop:1252 length:630 start_codon:yes stop_codon:yes gene_type:complete
MNQEIIFKYFPTLTELQKQQITQLGELYRIWNQKINVISRKDINNFYLHHVLHSLSIAKVVEFKSHTEIMDAGTGGGFPGIPLAIFFPKVKFFLVDSIGKKIKVVNEVVQNLGLKNVEAEQQRIEQVNQTFDFIISRAVTSLPDFLRWTSYKFHNKSFNQIPNGILYLKGGEIQKELNEIRKVKKKIYNISDYFKDDYFETKKLVHIYR